MQNYCFTPFKINENYERNWVNMVKYFMKLDSHSETLYEIE